MRAENRAAAAQLTAIGQVVRPSAVALRETEDPAADTMTAVAAEIAAALRISRTSENGLHDAGCYAAPPQVGAVFAAGQIDYRTFQRIVYHTDLLTDEQILARMDAAGSRRRDPLALADQGPARSAGGQDRGPRDDDALRRRTKRHGDREVWIGDPTRGCASWGGLLSPDAHAVNQKLTALAATVCATIRAPAPSAAPTPWAPWPPTPKGWPAGAGGRTVRPAPACRLAGGDRRHRRTRHPHRRRRAGPAVSADGLIPPTDRRTGPDRHTGATDPPRPHRTQTQLHPVESAGRFRALGPDVSLARL